MTGGAREPYKGLRPYGAGDRQRFFGRAAEARAVLERWEAEPLTVLHGPAGVGKTSLLQAAVVPLAEEAAGLHRVVLPVGRIAPAAASESGGTDHNPLVRDVLSSWSPAGAPVGEIPLPIPDFLGRLRASRAPELPPVFAAIDQFERAFRDVAHQPYRQDFLEQLVAAVREVPGLHLLVVIREDSVSELGALEVGISRAGRFRLGSLNPDAALRAVAGPVRGSGRSYAPGVAQEVVRNLRTSRVVDAGGGRVVDAGGGRVVDARGVDARGESQELLAETVHPVQLQAACSALWPALPPGVQVVTRELLYSPGDLDGRLVQFCEHAVHEVAVAREVPEPDLWSWLVRTFVTDRGRRDTAYEGAGGVGGLPAEIADQLVDRYLLTAESRLGSRWYQLTNDRLVAPVREAAGRWAAEAAGGTDPAGSLAAAEDALVAGDVALAAQRAAEAVRTSGRDLHTRATALSCLGRIAAETGQDQDAESHHRAAAALFELVRDQAGAGRSLAEVGRILLRRGRYAEAVAELQGAEARLPSELAVQLDLARALRESGQLWAATAVLGATLTVSPGTVDALVERGLIRIETGEFSAALDDLDNAVRIRPSVGHRAEIRSARALARDRLGRSA